MLDHCQRGPVVMETSGRRHSLLLSAAQYGALVAAQAAAPAREHSDPGRAFYEQHKDWVDAMNAEVESQALWNDALRIW